MVSRSSLIFYLCAFVVLPAAIAGCTGGNPPIDYPPPVPITVALPYVEAVQFPSEIHAGQPFTIEFELSCQQFPDALRSPARPFAPSDLGYGPNELEAFHYVWVVLHRDAMQINATEPLRTKVSFDIRGLSAGEHSVGFLAARTRGEGGMQIQVDRLTWLWLGRDQSVFGHGVPFTVLP